MSHCYIFAPKNAVETQGVRMHRFMVMVISVLLIAGYVVVWHVAPSGLLFVPGWAPYISS